MHRRVEWMVAADDQILHLLDQHRLDLSAAVIAHNVGYGKDHVRRRCKTLLDHGMIETADAEGGPYYRLAERGQQYVAGELHPSDLE